MTVRTRLENQQRHDLHARVVLRCMETVPFDRDRRGTGTT